MERIFNWEQWRIIAISTVMPVIWVCNPDKGICLALVVMFGVQYLGGNEDGRRDNCSMQKLFVPKV